VKCSELRVLKGFVFPALCALCPALFPAKILKKQAKHKKEGMGEWESGRVGVGEWERAGSRKSEVGGEFVINRDWKLPDFL